jgi:hypothetical protein
MNSLFSGALIAQTLFAALFIIHRFFQPLGSNLAFGIFILSVLVGGYLLWQCFKNPDIQGILKWVGLILGFLPFLGVIWMVVFLSGFKMH